MVKYLVDASIIVESLITGPFTTNAQKFFARTIQNDQYFAPEICLAEVTNVIWKSVRFHGMTMPTAVQTLRDLKKLPINRVAVKAVLKPALEIGLKHQLAVYDSLYIAIALQMNLPLITLDRKQSVAAQNEGVALVPITQFI